MFFSLALSLFRIVIWAIEPPIPKSQGKQDNRMFYEPQD